MLQLSLAGAVCGCALQPPAASDTQDDVQFLDRAIEAGPHTREAMWRAAQANADRGPDGVLRLALLQSLPDHPGYDPAAAQRSLRALIAQGTPDNVVLVARWRLAELRNGMQCQGANQDLQTENQELKRRLSRVVEIERQIDSKDR